MGLLQRSIWLILLFLRLITISVGAQPGVSRREAYVTLLYGEEWLLGVRVLGRSLRDTDTKKYVESNSCQGSQLPRPSDSSKCSNDRATAHAIPSSVSEENVKILQHAAMNFVRTLSESASLCMDQLSHSCIIVSLIFGGPDLSGLL
jgi:hypothetical protein